MQELQHKRNVVIVIYIQSDDNFKFVFDVFKLMLFCKLKDRGQNVFCISGPQQILLTE